MHKDFLGLLFTIAICAISGCAQTTQKSPSLIGEHPQPIVCVDETAVLEHIAQAADEIHKETLVMRQLAQSNSGVVISETQSPPAGSLAQKITIRFAGPLTAATEKIANILGYSTKTTGQAPPQPVIVDLDYINTPVYDVLASMGWQAGENVGLIISEEHEELKIVFSRGG